MKLVHRSSYLNDFIPFCQEHRWAKRHTIILQCDNENVNEQENYDFILLYINSVELKFVQ